jgi:hypothetical protein
LGVDFLKTAFMNQVWIFENLKTTIINSNNHPNNQQELGASFNTHPTVESAIDLPPSESEQDICQKPRKVT